MRRSSCRRRTSDARQGVFSSRGAVDAVAKSENVTPDCDLLARLKVVIHMRRPPKGEHNRWRHPHNGVVLVLPISVDAHDKPARNVAVRHELDQACERRDELGATQLQHRLKELTENGLLARSAGRVRGQHRTRRR